ncbi:DUF2116 family Zn-ribbon domain-containing protein [Citrobacter freundii]|nr:DUF2116 family Zn-ribbon domain-containing protein [Citrobacter freundii]
MITKPCPFCGKLIAPESLICSHCLVANPFVKAARRERFRNVLVFITVAFLLVALMVLLYLERL